MANTLYPIARQQYLTGQVNWDIQNIGVMLLTDLYDYDPLHYRIADIAVGARVSSAELGAQTSADGYANGAGVTFVGLTFPQPITKLVMYDEDAGNFEASTLVAFYDGVSGFPLTATGGNYQVLPDLSFGGFFRL